MSRIFDRLDNRKKREIKVLADFVAVYCRQNHRDDSKEALAIRDDRLRRSLDGKKLMLCPECSQLLHHGIAKLLLCPYDPKPACKKCPTHCYAPGYRECIRKVMRFSGPYLLKHGHFDLVFPTCDRL
jgi:hypothetical protein